MNGGMARLRDFSPRRPLVWLLASVLLVPLVSAELNSFGIAGARLLYDAVALPRLVLSLVTCIAAWTAWSISEKPSLPRSGPLLTLAAVSLFAALSTAFGADPLHSVLGQSERLEGLVAWALYPLLVGAGIIAVRRARDLLLLVRALAGSAALASVHGLLQFLGVVAYASNTSSLGFDEHRAFATFENPNFLAGLLVLALPLAVGLAWTENHPRWRRLALAEALVIGAALVAAMTRGAWVALVLQAVLGLILLGRGRVRGSRAVIVVVALSLLVVIVVGAVSLLHSGEANVVERLAQSGSITERAQLWRISAAASVERPLLGWGPDAFLHAFRQHRSGDYVVSVGPAATLNNAHSWPLQTAVTLGIPAALLFVVGLIWTLGASARVVHSRRADTEIIVYAAAWLGCVGFLTHLSGNVAVSGATTPFFIVLGALLAPTVRLVELRQPARNGIRLTLVSALFVVAAAATALVVADGVYLRSRFMFHRDVAGEAVASAALATRLNPTSVKYARGRAEACAQRFYDERASGEYARESFEIAAREFGAVVRTHPADYAARAWQAALLASAARSFGDEGLRESAAAAAKAAQRLDAQAAQVRALAGGSIAESATLEARGVAALP